KGSNGCVRQQLSFTSSKAKQILPFGIDRDNETRNGFKSRLFTLLVLVLDPAIAGPLKSRSRARVGLCFNSSPPAFAVLRRGRQSSPGQGAAEGRRQREEKSVIRGQTSRV